MNGSNVDSKLEKNENKEISAEMVDILFREVVYY